MNRNWDNQQKKIKEVVSMFLGVNLLSREGNSQPGHRMNHFSYPWLGDLWDTTLSYLRRPPEKKYKKKGLQR